MIKQSDAKALCPPPPPPPPHPSGTESFANHQHSRSVLFQVLVHCAENGPRLCALYSDDAGGGGGGGASGSRGVCTGGRLVVVATCRCAASSAQWTAHVHLRHGGGGGGWARSLYATPTSPPPPPPPPVLRDSGVGAMAPTVPNFLSHASLRGVLCLRSGTWHRGSSGRGGGEANGIVVPGYHHAL